MDFSYQKSSCLFCEFSNNTHVANLAYDLPTESPFSQATTITPATPDGKLFSQDIKETYFLGYSESLELFLRRTVYVRVNKDFEQSHAQT